MWLRSVHSTSILNPGLGGNFIWVRPYMESFFFWPNKRNAHAGSAENVVNHVICYVMLLCRMTLNNVKWFVETKSC